MLSAVTRFLRKTYYWSKLEKLPIDEPIFVLTEDIDSTALSDEEMELLRTTLTISKEYEIPSWIFITPDPVGGLERLCDKVRKWGGDVIIGCHGLKHISFSKLSYEEQFSQLVASMEIFREIGIDVFAVRTPWLSLNKYTYQAVSDAGFRFDFSTGFGFPAKFFSSYLRPKKLKETIFIPLNTPPDLYFRGKKKSGKEMSSVWISYSNSILSKCGVVSFLIHPAKFDDQFALESLLKHVSQQNINFMKKDWKSAFRKEYLGLEKLALRRH
jgi:peptidoglycan/xylan/chitin deacetylase (PgdA/CDA1 family)